LRSIILTYIPAQMKQLDRAAKKESRRLVYRISGGGSPEPGLPLAVRSTGYYQLPAGWQENSQAKFFLELFWVIRGSGTHGTGCQSWDVKAGDIFIYDAGEEHHLKAGEGGWDYRFFTLDSSGAGTVRDLFGLARRQVAGACPVALFERLAELLESPTVKSHREASVVAYAILEAAGRRTAGHNPREAGVAARARAIIDRKFTKAGFGMETLAGTLSVHRTTLRRVFLGAYGICPSTYLARRRLQQALSMLRTTTLPVADVAAAAGFTSAEYLARLVRAHTGATPSQFRRVEDIQVGSLRSGRG